MFCGIDLGTSSVKASVFDEHGRQLAFSRREIDLVLPQTGLAELDPENYLVKVYETLRDVSAQCHGNIASIAVSSQAQAVVPIDRMGTPLYNIIVTMDNRTLRQYRFWKEHHDEWEIYKRTGNGFASIYTVNKIMWFIENRPDIYEKTWKFCCVQDYVVFKLTGEGPFIDYSMAGRTMMLSSERPEWDSGVLDMAGISKDKLSEPVSSTATIGRVREDIRAGFGLSRTCQVVLGGHDQACGAVGSGVITPGMVMDACGTVDAMVSVLPGFIIDRAMLDNKLPCYRHVDGTNYITMAINTNGGLFLKWYKNTFCHEESQLCGEQNCDIYTYIIKECANTPADIYVLPHLEGAGTPVNDPLSLGAVIGLRVTHTKKDITRAVLDSLGYEMKLNLSAIEQSTGQSIEEIRMIGGGAKSPKWLQIKADIFNRSITVLETQEAASLGAAITGAVGTGYFEDFGQAIQHMVHPKETYIPNPAMVKEYETRFEEYKRIYPGLKDISHRISSRTSIY